MIRLLCFVFGRVRLTNKDRWFLIVLYRWFPSILRALTILRAETLIHWHRSGFRTYCRCKSRPLEGRPPIKAWLRALIRQISIDNPLWGVPRIHRELLKLGFEVAQSSVANYMVKRRGPPSQGWLTFLRNCVLRHASIAPPLRCQHGRREAVVRHYRLRLGRDGAQQAYLIRTYFLYGVA